jgi:hypothetical protein
MKLHLGVLLFSVLAAFVICGHAASDGISFELTHVFSSAPPDAALDQDMAEIVTFSPFNNW